MSPQSRPWKSAIGWAIACSALFMAVYNFCNWVTTQRGEVPTWAFSWETEIPFIPVMIIPYWSLDLFFAGAFFVCGAVQQQRLLAKRLALAISAAGVCFLLFPLRLAFPRPPVEGFLGLWFAALRSFDQPHNLAPSLHIALRTLLWPVYIPATTGWLNLALRGWFILIGFSTLFTYQHQVMDVVTGWVLAVFCIALLAEPNVHFDAKRRIRNGRVGTMYLAAAMASLAGAIAFWPWGAVLAWPATACGLMVVAYFWLGAQIYEKRGGQIPWTTRFLLGPVIFAQYLSLAYYKRQCRAWDEASPGVLIGRRLNEMEARGARGKGITAVLDLTVEFSEPAAFRAANYLNVPVLDLTAPTQEQLQTAVAFIRSERRRGTVYVHCKIGYSRSAAVAGAYLLDAGLATTADDAIARLRQVRPTIVIRPEAEQALRDYAARLQPEVAAFQAPALGF